jgi:hypothetical protein
VLLFDPARNLSADAGSQGVRALGPLPATRRKKVVRDRAAGRWFELSKNKSKRIVGTRAGLDGSVHTLLPNPVAKNKRNLGGWASSGREGLENQQNWRDIFLRRGWLAVSAAK